MNMQLDEQVLGVAAVASLLLLLLLIWVIRLGSKLKKLRKQYAAVMGGNGVADLEQVIADLQTRLRVQEERGRQLGDKLARATEAMSRMKGRVGVNRYNAFAETGSDLSFSVAIVDEHLDGVVLSGIRSREETYVYAKPVQQGESTYALTPEEREAINRAVQPQSTGGKTGERP